MEPWQEAELRLLAKKDGPRCQCCGVPVTTERYLELEPFGIRGVACEKCVDRHLRWLP